MSIDYWKGDGGNSYTDEWVLDPKQLDLDYISKYGKTRTALNSQFLEDIDMNATILEVGSNCGNQLLMLRSMGFKNVSGIEPNRHARNRAFQRGMTINSGDVYHMPDLTFDVVFTSGVLIHIPEHKLKAAMTNIYNASKRYIWGFEYWSKEREMIPYHGKTGLLWKDDFPTRWAELYPGIKLQKYEFVFYLDNKKCDIMYMLEK